MPVSKTAKRALRGSRRKATMNKLTLTKLDIAVRQAKKAKTKEKILKAISLSDKASKKHAIHKNKAARIKSALTKLLPKGKAIKAKSPKKTTNKSSK